jgi:hypothetical protein
MGKATGKPFEVCKNPVAPFSLQPRHRVGEETIVIRNRSLPGMPPTIAHASPNFLAATYASRAIAMTFAEF